MVSQLHCEKGIKTRKLEFRTSAPNGPKVPERAVAKLLRHACVATTRKFYASGTVQQSAGIILRDADDFGMRTVLESFEHRSRCDL